MNATSFIKSSNIASRIKSGREIGIRVLEGCKRILLCYHKLIILRNIPIGIWHIFFLLIYTQKSSEHFTGTSWGNWIEGKLPCIFIRSFGLQNTSNRWYLKNSEQITSYKWVRKANYGICHASPKYFANLNLNILDHVCAYGRSHLRLLLVESLLENSSLKKKIKKN